MAGYNIDLQKALYHHAIKNVDYLNLIKKEYFESEHIKILFSVVKAYFTKYTKIPSQNTIHHLLDRKELLEKLPISAVDMIYDVDMSKYDEDFLERRMRAFIRHKAFQVSWKDAYEYFKTQDITEDNIEMVVNTVLKNFNEKNSITFTTDSGLEIFDPTSHLPDISSARKSTGYDYLDLVSSGGMAMGELWLLMGRTNIGKSIWLCNLAKNFICQGHNTVYISLEMGEKDILARIGSNMFSVPILDYYKNVDSDTAKKRINDFKKSQGFLTENLGKLWIKRFPGSSFSTLDLQSFIINNIEKTNNVKVDVVIVDYINLMQNWRNPNSEDSYKTVKKISEDLRSSAISNDWIIVTATQVNRAAFDKEEVDMQDISESAGLLHTCDFVGALSQTPEMNSRGIYYLKTLKNRKGGFLNSKKTYHVNYEYMVISESSEPHTEYGV